jgi:4,5-dihydroxyphthalate decarboxylase
MDAGAGSMTRLRLSLAVTDNPRTRPIARGVVVAEGIDWTPTVIHPSELFWRQLHFGDFAISEMSISSLLKLHSLGRLDWVGLPVFTSRRFYHAAILVRNGAGIEQPADLRGKRVGVPEYQQTSALWVRGAPEHEFGVRPRDMRWFMERSEGLSHGGATEFAPPPGVELERVPARTSIASMLVYGELDAIAFYIPERNLIDRPGVDPLRSGRVTTLFPNPQAEAERYFRKTGIHPANHCVVIRRSLVEAHPWLTLNVFKAFWDAKQLAREELRSAVQPHLDTGRLGPHAAAELATDLFPYGVERNRAMLETLARYSAEQCLAQPEVAVDQAFAAPTHDFA